ncbi:MAG: DnaJ C-terminal domain-containing protein [Verrucomicrobiota bacterium]|jgi:curved DNA-binding protein
MPVEFKDYYQTLGVPRTASSDEIRKAFRSLARQYHPDVAKEKNKKAAEEKFKSINEAYEVLGDPAKRKQYDELGADWKAGAQFRPPPGGPSWRTYGGRPGPADARENFQFGGTGFSDFFEQLFGGGRGAARAGGFDESEAGRGHDIEAVLMVTLEEAMNGSVRSISLRRNALCPECHGTGAKGRNPCPACLGEGQVSITQNHKVKIPAGVRDGQRLRVPGQGEPGAAGGAAGDLYLRVRLAGHPDFRVEGGDLYYDLDLAPWEAALGASVSVPALNGALKIKIPSGTQNGQRLRLKGRGLPGRAAERGDLFVVARIQMPREITEREKTLWHQLAAESSFHPRS